MTSAIVFYSLFLSGFSASGLVSLGTIVIGFNMHSIHEGSQYVVGKEGTHSFNVWWSSRIFLTVPRQRNIVIRTSKHKFVYTFLQDIIHIEC